MAVRRVSNFINPDAYLLRVDWSKGEVAALSLYSRFPQPPSESLFQAIMAHARPFRWDGRSPEAIASILGVAGPRGMGMRVSKNGNRHVALYYKVTSKIEELDEQLVGKLLHECKAPMELASQVTRDLKALYSPGELGVVGIDSESDNGTGAVKFDPSNVLFDKARRFLSTKSISPAILERLRAISNILRSQVLTYLGLKYGRNGFAGWKAYFSTEPCLLMKPDLPFIETRNHAHPTFGMAHN